MSDTVNYEPITNIDDFKTAIDNIKESFRIHHGENLEFFYRGEKEEYESFGASIYRKMGKDGLQQRLKSEYKIYKEVQRMFPDDFPQEDDVLLTRQSITR